MRFLINNLKNILGKKTNRKIVVIESDDWGSVRMPSLDVYQKMKNAGLDLESGDSWRYNKYDTLASSEDLSLLFDVLSKFKDKNNNNAKFTVVSLAANPDFESIKKSGYSKYFYEPFVDTLSGYGKKNVFNLWLEGSRKNIFVPQFHGREHLNVASWMRALHKKDKHTLIAFENGCWGFVRKNGNPGYQAAFDLEFISDIEMQKQIIADGLDLFEKLHGYKASYFVPPNGPINNSLEEITAEKGVKYIMTSKIQLEALGSGKVRKRYHYLGQRNKYNQFYITRNCFFEPSLPGIDWVDSCMSEINCAFRWEKPAVICSHRVNYIGGLYSENRSNGLKQLNNLLSGIVKKWSDVEFMTSNELGDEIEYA